ncbi:sialidase-3-like [Dicentrarchus labrax]|uniref:exo-alpha-sialidase n=1 Tax=Dicentrarchus labrax TaxID=13489 RepID=A0A8C4EHT5_DICLA|nr:sialidase-3-like [Dicentrarchus labrax]
MGNKPSSQQQQERKKIVFYSKEKEVYRIPALFYANDKQIFMAFAEQRRTADDTSSKNLVMKTGTLKIEESSSVRTIEWSELKLVKEAHLHGYRPMNPCPVYEKRSKKLFLFFICVEGTVSECWQRFWGCNKARLCYVTTIDAGQSWSSVTDLTTKLGEIKNWSTFAVGPGHGLQTESGRLIVPLYAFTSLFRSYALYLYSDDMGNNWQFSNMLQTKSNECQMAEVSDGIYCNARSDGGYRVEALDMNTLFPKTLAETGSGCQGSVVSFPAHGEHLPNKWLLFTHPSDKSSRINLGVYLNKSPSDPKAWSKPWIINKGPSGYSDLAYIGDGWFACLMERGEQKEIEQIASIVFSYNEVNQGIVKKK